jgi:hypothetical protein
VLSKIAQVIEMAGLQVGSRRADIRHRSLDHDVGGDIFDRRIRDFMDEADILLFAGSDPGDDLTPCDFRIHDGLAAAAAVIDHHDKVLHVGVCPRRITKTKRQYFG